MVPETLLVDRLKRGEKAAIHTWYAVYAPKLRSFFSSKVRQVCDVDELTHDTFLSCLSSLPLYRGDAKFFGWMLSIARHELADYYRKLYAKKMITALPLGEQILETALHETGDAQFSVKEVLHQLPASVSELLSLKYIDKLSVETIALRLCVSPHSIQSRLYRARNMFRKAYEAISLEQETSV